jgi:uncharacterized oxidoreductase
MAAVRQEKVPEGWLLDKDGRPTTNPYDFLQNGGVLLPFGGYKGYGLAMSVEILSGILTGSAYSKHIAPGFATQGGFSIFTINIENFRPHKEYTEDVLRLVKLIKTCPPAEGFSEILLPGEIESREYKKRSKYGISVYEEAWNDIDRISKDLGVKMPLLTR